MTRNTLGFSELRNRYIVDGRLLVCAPLHVGSGYTDEWRGSDSGFVQDATGPFVPGSSLRGVMRTTIERILQSLGGARGCVLFEENADCACPTSNKKAREALEKQFENVNDERAWMVALSENLCDVCRLFGSPLIASKLKVDDARPANGSARLNKRDGVGIDRDTETARDAIKFDFVAMESHTAESGSTPLELSFRLQLENVDGGDLALVAILLRELETAGMDVGGKKARGLGRVKLKPDYAVHCFRNPGELLAFLSGVELTPLPAKEFRKVLNAAVGEYFKTYFQGGNHVPSGR